MAGLDGPRLRWERAREHLPYLEGLVEAIVQTYANGVVAYYDTDASDWKPRRNVLEPVQARVSISAGEIVYNLRAALDYLVYVLAWHDSGSPKRGTQFPIEDEEDRFAARRKSFLKGLSEEHVAILRQYQPFNNCYWTGMLRDLSNADKHRELVSVEADFEPVGGRLVVDLDAYNQLHLDADGNIIPETMDMYLRGAAEVLLPDGGGVVDTLQELVAEVAKLLSIFDYELG